MKIKLIVLAILLTAAPALADMTANMTFRYDDQSIPELAMVQLEILLDGQPSCTFDTTGYQPGDSFTTECIPDGDIPPGLHSFSARATLANGSYSAPSLVAMGRIPVPNPPVIVPDPNPVVIESFTITVRYPNEPEQVVETTLQAQ